MLGLTDGELFLLGFIVLAVVTWAWWPRLGEAIAGLVAGPQEPSDSPGAGSEPPPEG